MSETNSLTIFTRASEMLAQADTIQKAKELKNLALTAADWARRKNMGAEAVQYARSYALEAERRMGEMLIERENAQGKRTDLVGKADQVDKQTLKELGISRDASSEAQKLAKLPVEKFHSIATGAIPRTKVIREVKREQRQEELKDAPKLPTGKYRVIYADPPWKYNDKCDDGAVQSGGCEQHYPSMSIQELCDLPVEKLCEDNAVLFLWVTSPLLSACWPIVGAWGFTYKANFIWDKIKHNMGHYNSVRHELLLICTRGSCTPDVSKLHDSVVSVERGKHSEKPEIFRAIIDEIYPHGKRIELFARNKHDGWDVYGNEILQ